MSVSGNKSDWQERYTRLYSVRSHAPAASAIPEDPSRGISFMNNNVSPYTSLLARNWQEKKKARNDLTVIRTEEEAVAELTSLDFDSEDKVADLADSDPSLLQLLRSRRQSSVSTQLLDLSAREVEEDEESVVVRSELYTGTRALDTERSASRTRTSTRRPDMHATTLAALLQPYRMKQNIESYRQPILEQVSLPPPPPPPPRWSLRRSVCPACSQKWKDRRSINIIKHSGLKRNSSAQYSPSVIAPARLQTAIMSQYSPRFVPAAMDSGSSGAMLSAGGAAWLLTRARRARPPSPTSRARAPSPNALVADTAGVAPAYSFSLEASPADLNRRVNSFLTGNIR